MSVPPLLPCPGCGFLIHPEPRYGSYGICPLCNWEDCAGQLGNPLDAGGPNGKSLVEHQAIGLAGYPLDVREVALDGRRVRRDERWRPLSVEEIEVYARSRDVFPATYHLSDCYWMRATATGEGSADAPAFRLSLRERPPRSGG